MGGTVSDSQLRSTGRDYTPTICLLALAFIFSPVVLAASRPVSYLSISLAAVCSVVCAALAWRRWTRSSQLTIPSISGGNGE